MDENEESSNHFIWSESYNLSDYITKAQFTTELVDLESVNDLSKPACNETFSRTLSNYSLMFDALITILSKICQDDKEECTCIVEVILLYLSYDELYILESTHINWVTQRLSVFLVNNDISKVICTINLDLNKIFDTYQLRSQISEKSLKTMIKDIQSNNFDNQSKSRQNRIEYSNCDIGKCFVGEYNDLLLLIPMKTSKNGNLQTFVIQCFMVVHYQQDNKNKNKNNNKEDRPPIIESIELRCENAGKILNIGSMHVHAAWFFYDETSENDSSDDSDTSHESSNEESNSDSSDSDSSSEEKQQLQQQHQQQHGNRNRNSNRNSKKERKERNRQDQNSDHSLNHKNNNNNGRKDNRGSGTRKSDSNSDSKSISLSLSQQKIKSRFASTIYLEHSTQEGNVNILSINRMPMHFDYYKAYKYDYFFQNVHFESSMMKCYNIKCMIKMMENIYHIIHSIKDTIYETPIDFTIAGIKSSITDTVTINNTHSVTSTLNDQKIKQITPIDSRHYVNVLGCAIVPQSEINENTNDDSDDENNNNNYENNDENSNKSNKNKNDSNSNSHGNENKNARDEATPDIEGSKIDFDKIGIVNTSGSNNTPNHGSKNNSNETSDTDSDVNTSEIDEEDIAKKKQNRRLRAASAHWRRLEKSLDFNNPIMMPDGQDMIDILKSESDKLTDNNNTNNNNNNDNSKDSSKILIDKSQLRHSETSLDNNSVKNMKAMYDRYTSPRITAMTGVSGRTPVPPPSGTKSMIFGFNPMLSKSANSLDNSRNYYSADYRRRSSVVEKRQKIEQHSRRNSLLISNKKTAFDVFDAVLLVVYGSGVIGSEMTDLYVAYLDSDYDIIKQTTIYLSPKLSAAGNGINGNYNYNSSNNNNNSKKNNNNHRNVNRFSSINRNHYSPLQSYYRPMGGQNKQQRVTVATTLLSHQSHGNDSKMSHTKNASKVSRKTTGNVNTGKKRRKKKNVSRFINNCQKIDYVECNGDWILFVSFIYQTKRNSQTHYFEIKLNKFLNIKYIKRVLTNKFYFKTSLRNLIHNRIWKKESSLIEMTNSNGNSNSNSTSNSNGKVSVDEKEAELTNKNVKNVKNFENDEFFIDCNPVIMDEVIDGESSHLIRNTSKFFGNEFYGGPRDSMWHIDYNRDSMLTDTLLPMGNRQVSSDSVK